MQALLEQRQRVMRVGQHVRLSTEVVGGFGKARQHVLEEHLEPLLSHRQACSQRHDPFLYLGIKAAQRTPRRLRDGAAAQ